MIKITGGQRIDLVGVRKEDPPAVWRDLDMPSGHAYGKSFRTAKTCVGSDLCRFGLGNSTALGSASRSASQGWEAPRSSSSASPAAHATARRRWSRTSASSPSRARAGRSTSAAPPARTCARDLPCTVDSADEVILRVGRFIQYYRENARWLKRTYGFMQRVGLETVRAVVVEDRGRDGERLDAEMQRSLAAYAHPWLEGRDLVTANQFQTVLGPS